jgi:Xaa-Pro dipeptidase
MGRISTPDEWKQHYQVDQVLYTEDLESYLEGLVGVVAEETPTSTTATNTAKKTILLMQGPNTDSGNTYAAPTFQSTKLHAFLDTSTLFPILAECRVFKSTNELLLLEHVAQISSFAHAYVMRNCRVGMMEYQCESLFKHYAYFNYGSRIVSYTNICGCGPNAAILHYGHAGEPNARQISEDDNCLFDMGAEYQCYASDITCSFPANGKFTNKYKGIYNGVLQAQIAVYNMMKPGVSYVDCHKRAELEILKALTEIGIVVLPGGDNDDTSLEELVERRLGAVFMPHGLGHFLGIDCHDVGGYLPGHPERSLKPGLKKLRTARILQANMVLTVEPGCYFIDHLLDGALSNPELSKYLNAELLQDYRGYGGVRLEDVVTITTDGCVNFTLCPRTVQEVEHVMAGGVWPPTQDAAPELRRVKLTEPISPFPPPPSR